MKNIGVFFGGKSPEHDVSIITAQLVIAGLKKLGFDILPVYLNKDGKWFLGDQFGSIEFFRRSDRKLKNEFCLDLNAALGKMTFRQKGLMPKTLSIDCAFPAFHGQNGEDGTIQGLFELFDIPYVGCGVVSSAIAIDKALTKLFFEKYGFPTAKFIYFYKKDWERDNAKLLNEITAKLQWPLFVKPARLGSSIGISRVKNEEDLTTAIEVALHYDGKVLVEEGVENAVDVTCAVLGNDEARVSLLQESVFGGAFFSYEDKYLKGGGAQLGKAKNNIIITARLDKETTGEIQTMAKDAFFALECSGIARVDFLYDKELKKAYVNEVNTLPGTLYHHLWKASGIELDELLSELLRLAQEKHDRKAKLITAFDSNILEQADWSSKLQSKTSQ